MTTEKKEYTPMQAAFLEHLFGDANGDVRTAMRMAGYTDNTKMKEVLRPLRDEIVEQASMVLAANAPKAVFSMIGVINDPGAMGARNAVSAAKEILDRAGLVKKEQIEVTTQGGGMFVLPPKKSAEYDESDE